MDPFSMMLIMGIGLGVQAFGAAKSTSAASDINKAQKEQIQLEQQVESQRKIQMENESRRMKLENLRKVQQAQSMGMVSGANQGALFGTGFQGGQQQASSQGQWNEQGMNQSLQTGENIFGINSQISQQKILQANASQQAQLGSAITSFGSSLTSSVGPFGRVASGFGGNPKVPTSGSGGNVYGPTQGTMW